MGYGYSRSIVAQECPSEEVKVVEHTNIGCASCGMSFLKLTKLKTPSISITIYASIPYNILSCS